MEESRFYEPSSDIEMTLAVKWQGILFVKCLGILQNPDQKQHYRRGFCLFWNNMFAVITFQ